MSPRRTAALGGVALAASLFVVPGVAQAGVLRHALVVGANDGGGSLEPLRYAELDAERFAGVMVELGGMDAADVTVLYGPTARELQTALRWHAELAARSPDDLFLFYYSGHADARGLRLGAEVYPFETLKADMRATPAEVKLGVLDACRSGQITRLKGAQVTTPFLVEQELEAEGEAWMTAASADEDAQESDRLRGSFFTHYLISGLRGAADTGDGDVSLDEAYRYAFDRVVDNTGGTVAGAQHPNFDYRLKGQGDLSLTRVTEGQSTVTFPAELAGQIVVLKMPDRTPVAEVAKRPGAAAVLALAPGTYLFRWRPDGARDSKEALVGLANGARLTLTRWTENPSEAGGVKGAPLAHDALDLARKAAETQVPWVKVAVNPEDLRRSPAVAAGSSLVLPGAGQFYNRQWVKGGLYLAGFATAMGGSLLAVDADNQFFHGSITGPDYLRLTAAMLYGASVADAAYNVNQREDSRPRTGWALSTASAWTPDQSAATPWVAGVNVEWIPQKNVGLALDRVGWTSSELGSGAWGLGGKGSVFFLQTDHLRPSLFVAGGMRYRYAKGDPGFLVPTVGAGGSLRWYVTPRYFVENEWRVELEDANPRFTWGGGLGVQFGAPR